MCINFTFLRFMKTEAGKCLNNKHVYFLDIKRALYFVMDKYPTVLEIMDK